MPSPPSRLLAWVSRQIPNWSALRSLGQSPAVKFSPIWLSLVPALMRFAGWGSGVLSRSMEVPFNFEMFYFAALFFLIAIILFAWRCPKLMKEAPNYGVIQSAIHSEVDLRKWFHEVVQNPAGEPDPKLIQQYLSLAYGYDNVSDAQMTELLAGKAGHALLDPFWGTSAGARLPNVYDFVRGTADQVRPKSRALTAAAFVAGFLFMGAVFLYNGISVVKYLTRSGEQSMQESSQQRLHASLDAGVTITAHGTLTSAKPALPLPSPHQPAATDSAVPPKLWITYAWANNTDGDFDYLVGALQKSGIPATYDKVALIPGRRLWEQIGDQISKGALSGWAYLITPESLRSQACREELAYALDRMLSTKGVEFPLIGLLHGVSIDDVPPALKVRLCVDLRSPDWMEQVKAAVEGRPPVAKLEKLEANFKVRVVSGYGGVPGRQALEFTPRFGEIRNWRVAFPADGPQPITIGSGPAAGGGVSMTQHDTLEGTVDIDGLHMKFCGAGDPLTPGTSAYLVFDGALPRAFAFGWAAGPSDVPVQWWPFRSK